MRRRMQHYVKGEEEVYADLCLGVEVLHGHGRCVCCVEGDDRVGNLHGVGGIVRTQSFDL